MWTETGRENTSRVAKAAGSGERRVDRLFLIAEPEAVGIAAPKGYSGEGVAAGVFSGVDIMICD